MRSISELELSLVAGGIWVKGSDGTWRDDEQVPQEEGQTGDRNARERDDSISDWSCAGIATSVGMTVTILAIETGPSTAKAIGSAAGAATGLLCNTINKHIQRDERRRGNAQIP